MALFFNAPERGSVTGNSAMVRWAQPVAVRLAMMRECNARQKRWAAEYAEGAWHQSDRLCHSRQVGATRVAGSTGLTARTVNLLGRYLDRD